MKEIIKKLKNKVIIGNIITIGITIIVIKLLLPIIGQEVIEVTFESQANKNITYQLFYTSMSDEKFNEQKSLRQQVKAGKQSVKFSVPTQNMEQLRIDFGQVPEKASISHLRVNGKEIKALEFKNIINYHQIEKHEITNNQLTIYSREGDPFIVFPKNLNLKPQQFNRYLFFTVLIVSYFTVNGITKYLLNIKKEKINYFGLIFILCFFGSLFIPMMKISNETVSDLENRTLAKKPVLSGIFKEKSEYGKAFENWFNDHFFGRNQIMFVHDEIKNKASKVLKAKYGNEQFIYFKENGWMFSLAPDSTNSKLISQIMENIKKFNEFCKENNIKFYILSIPKKEIIYQELLDGFAEKQNEKLNEIYATIKKEAQKINVPLVDPLNEMQEAKQKDYVYFKWTHHWTDWGAYIGYRALMKEIQKDFQDIPVVTLNEYDKSQNKLIRDNWDRKYHTGNFERFFHLKNDESQSVNYNYYDHKDKNLLDIKIGKYAKDFSYSKGKYKILLFGTSMSDNFTQFIPYSGNELKYIRLNRGQVPSSDLWKIMKYYKDEILSFKPDILIYLVTNIHLKSLQWWFDN